MALRSYGLFGLRGQISENGENLSVTESLRLLEEVANSDLNLSNVIVNSTWYAAQFIRKYGSDEIKAKYLPGLHSGTSLAALCVADEFAGVDANSTKFVITQDPITGEICLDGRKLWVTQGGNADLLVVLGKKTSKSAGGQLYPRLMAVLVDVKKANGISVEPQSYPTRGLRGCGVTTVKFSQTEVPPEFQLAAPGEGFNALTECLKDEAKLAGCIQILAALRKALNLTIEHISVRTAYGAELNTFHLVQKKVRVTRFGYFCWLFHSQNR